MNEFRTPNSRINFSDMRISFASRPSVAPRLTINVHACSRPRALSQSVRYGAGWAPRRRRRAHAASSHPTPHPPPSITVFQG
jgi:hypothetical protein